MPFLGQFTFYASVRAGTAIALDPRDNADFVKACAFASRVRLISAEGEFMCLCNGTTVGSVFAGFVHRDVAASAAAVKASPNAVMVGASSVSAIERKVPFTANTFFGDELKGAILGHQPPKFVVWPVTSPGSQTDAAAEVLSARLTIVVELLGDGSGSAAT